ncbi:hypothetical protein [Oligoflexus tunisiensis]|uniref:hypothetical protein n=1 Tax=Oligoflexus tunisiensis TaxID=708132 RepID=UPI000A67C9C0|nr:hypothetical protein [Oligoflexus tunisiensis]
MIKNLGALSWVLAAGVLAGCGDDDSDDNNSTTVVTLGEPTQKVLAVSATGHDRFFSVAFDSAGNYYAAGSVADSTESTADSKMLVAKFKSDGELDTSFGTDGYAIHNAIVGTTGEVARSIVVQSSGKIVIAGTIEHAGASDTRDRDIGLLRLNTDGSLDSTFGTDGLVTLNLSEGEVSGTSFVADNIGGMTTDSSGRLLIHGSAKRDGGTDTDFVLTRLSADGVVDETFGTAGRTTLDIRNLSASPKPAIVLSSGQILGTGYMRDGSVVVPVIYRTDANGVLDTTYGENGIFSQAVLEATTEVYSAVVQGDSIVTVGYGRNSAEENLDFLSLRITSAGALDTTYGSNGYTRVDAAGFNDNGRNMTQLPDGRIALVGGGRTTAETADGMVAILNADGQADTTFAEKGARLFDFGGTADFLWGAAVSPAGDKAVIVGLKGAGADGNDDVAVVTIPLQ